MNRRLDNFVYALQRLWGYDKNGRRVRLMDRLELVASLLAIGLMFAMFVWVHNQGISLRQAQQELQRDKVTFGAQHLSLIEGCKRLQIVRIEENVSHQADFAVFSDVARTFGRADPSGDFARSLQAALLAKTWVPRTDCTKAVNTLGVHYRAPRPVRFADELPPKSAVTLYPSDFR